MSDSDPLERLKELSASLPDPQQDRWLLFVASKALEVLPDALIITDQGGQIIFFNSRAELMFGYDRSEALGKPIHILVPAGMREHHAHHVAGFFEDPRSRPMGTGQPLFGLHKNGNTFGVEINLNALASPIGIFAMAVVRRKPSPASEQ